MQPNPLLCDDIYDTTTIQYNTTQYAFPQNKKKTPVPPKKTPLQKTQHNKYKLNRPRALRASNGRRARREREKLLIALGPYLSPQEIAAPRGLSESRPVHGLAEFDIDLLHDLCARLPQQQKKPPSQSNPVLPADARKLTSIADISSSFRVSDPRLSWPVTGMRRRRECGERWYWSFSDGYLRTFWMKLLRTGAFATTQATKHSMEAHCAFCQLAGYTDRTRARFIRTSVRACCADLSPMITGMRIIVMETTKKPRQNRMRSCSLLRSSVSKKKSLEAGVDCIYVLPDEGKAGAEDQR